MAKNTETNNMKAPVVVVLGHVDHGKTSLLDAIRNTDVQNSESGGITQNIYISDIFYKDKKVTFVDTPGHEVFSLMRINGGKVADIALLIVAADESVKPQTLESIDIIQKQNVKFIVVITKVDKPEANVEKVKNDLISKGVYLEGHGGDIPFIEVSAHSKKGINELLDLIFLYTDVENLLEEETQKLKLIDSFGDEVDNIKSYAVVLDSSVDKALGKTAFCVLKYGVLERGTQIYAGSTKEKVGQLFDASKKQLKEAVAGTAFIITGLSELPASGIDIVVPKDTTKYESFLKVKNAPIEASEMSKEDILASIFADVSGNVIPIIIKTDVNASLQSIIPTFEKFNTEDVTVKVVSSGVGAITASDIDIAKTFNALLLGFRVKASGSTADYAKQQGVNMAAFDVVYHLYDHLNDHIQKTLGRSTEKVTVIGTAKVKQVFKLSDGEVVAGSVVTEGEIRKSATIRIVRDSAVVGETPINSLRVLKDERNEVKKGSECGINLGKEVDVQEGDILEAVIPNRS